MQLTLFESCGAIFNANRHEPRMDVIDLFFDEPAEEAASPELDAALWYKKSVSSQTTKVNA